MGKRIFVLPVIMVLLPLMAVAMSMCQILGHTISPAMSMWDSHVLTIILSSILATAGAYFILRKREMLIGQLQEEIVQRKQAEIKLQEQGTLLRDLSAKLRELEENERKRLAAKLHDLVGQDLSALEIELNIIRETMPADMPQPMHARLQDAAEKVEDTIETIRHVIADLRPSTLDDFGLTKTIRWYGKEFSQLTGITVEMQVAKLYPRLPVQTENTMFRILQEALVNVQKHAQATEVIISLQEEDNRIRLLIDDNGVGFDAASVDKVPERKNWGLVIMEERAVAAGGRFSIRSRPGQGTQIIVEVRR